MREIKQLAMKFWKAIDEAHKNSKGCHRKAEID